MAVERAAQLFTAARKRRVTSLIYLAPALRSFPCRCWFGMFTASHFARSDTFTGTRDSSLGGISRVRSSQFDAGSNSGRDGVRFLPGGRPAGDWRAPAPGCQARPAVRWAALAPPADRSARRRRSLRLQRANGNLRRVTAPRQLFNSTPNRPPTRKVRVPRRNCLVPTALASRKVNEPLAETIFTSADNYGRLPVEIDATRKAGHRTEKKQQNTTKQTELCPSSSV